MKKATALLACIFFYLGSQAQNEFQLAAERDGKFRLYKAGAAIKILYKGADTVQTFRGRIAAVTADSIVLQRFNDRSNGLAVAVIQLESVRRVRRVGRIITGAMAISAITGGIALIVEDNKEHGELLDGLGEGIGTLFIASSFVPYIVIAATETVSKTSKGYRFRVVRE